MGENHPKTIMDIHNIAYLHSKLGDHQKACEAYREAYCLKRNALGENDKSTINTLCQLAATLELLQEYREAAECYEKVYLYRKEVLGEDHEGTVIVKEKLEAIRAKL
jgi:tetratricopeptide (TPR) repeat protein